MIQLQIKKGVPLEAFCYTRPDVETVTTFLKARGFSLVYQMKAYPSPYHTIPALPAQYHYQDSCGTEVLYLAGRDFFNEDGVKLPPHCSRWWLYPGRDPEEAASVTQALTAQWFMMWFAVKGQKGKATP